MGGRGGQFRATMTRGRYNAPELAKGAVGTFLLSAVLTKL
jgi:hypothetical protein